MIFVDFIFRHIQCAVMLIWNFLSDDEPNVNALRPFSLAEVSSYNVCMHAQNFKPLSRRNSLNSFLTKFHPDVLVGVRVPEGVVLVAVAHQREDNVREDGVEMRLD